MTYERICEWGKEIQEAAKGALNSELSLHHVRAESAALAQAVEDWRADRLREAKSDGRDRLHADDQRTFDKLVGVAGATGLAVASVLVMDADAKANKANKLASGTRPAPAADQEWKSIFPSMGEYRAQSIGNDPAGGYLVTDHAGPFFDRLRPDSVVLQAGPRIELCESDALSIPLLSSSTTAEWTAENGDITESSVTLAKGRIPIRKYAVFTIGSSEWFADAAYGPRQLIEIDHRKQLAEQLDNDMLQANGVGIVGLRYEGTATSLAAAGATPTFDNVLDAIYRMEANNAKPSAMFMHPRTWNTFRKSQDLQDRYQLAPDPTQSAARRLFDIPVYLSSKVSITEASDNAANNDCSSIILADMRYVVVGRRQDVQVLYDPFSYSKSDRIALRSTTRWGMGVIHSAAVEVLTGVRP